MNLLHGEASLAGAEKARPVGTKGQSMGAAAGKQGVEARNTQIEKEKALGLYQNWAFRMARVLRGLFFCDSMRLNHETHEIHENERRKEDRHS